MCCHLYRTLAHSSSGISGYSSVQALSRMADKTHMGLHLPKLLALVRASFCFSVLLLGRSHFIRISASNKFLRVFRDFIFFCFRLVINVIDVVSGTGHQEGTASFFGDTHQVTVFKGFPLSIFAIYLAFTCGNMRTTGVGARIPLCPSTKRTVIQLKTRSMMKQLTNFEAGNDLPHRPDDILMKLPLA